MAIVHFITFGCVFSSSLFLDKKYPQSQNWSPKVVDIPFKVNNFLPKHKVQRSRRHFCFLCDDIVPKQIKSGQKPKELSQFSKQISRSTNLPKKLWSDQVFKRALEMEPESENWLISSWTCDTQWDRPSATYPHSQSMINGNTTLGLMWGIFITNTMLLFMMMVVTSKLPITRKIAITKKIMTLTTFCNDPPLGKSSKKKKNEVF